MFIKKWIGKYYPFERRSITCSQKSTKDHFPDQKLNLFFSGGLDSELMLKSFLAIGEEPNIFIVRYEDDINLYDVSYAVSYCRIIKPKF